MAAGRSCSHVARQQSSQDQHPDLLAFSPSVLPPLLPGAAPFLLSASNFTLFLDQWVTSSAFGYEHGRFPLGKP